MKMNIINKKGFTLIELLVVVAIIGLLASVILASLNSAREKSRDAAVKNAMIQFRTMLELEYNNSGSYAALQKGLWVSYSGSTCDSVYPDPVPSNDNVTKAREICKSIYNSSANDPNAIVDGHPTSRFYTGHETGVYTKLYSTMAYLPGQKKWLCIGSSGQSIVTWNTWGSGGPVGCWGNP